MIQPVGFTDAFRAFRQEISPDDVPDWFLPHLRNGPPLSAQLVIHWQQIWNDAHYDEAIIVDRITARLKFIPQGDQTEPRLLAEHRFLSAEEPFYASGRFHRLVQQRNLFIAEQMQEHLTACEKSVPWELTSYIESATTDLRSGGPERE